MWYSRLHAQYRSSSSCCSTPCNLYIAVTRYLLSCQFVEYLYRTEQRVRAETPSMLPPGIPVGVATICTARDHLSILPSWHKLSMQMTTITSVCTLDDVLGYANLWKFFKIHGAGVLRTRSSARTSFGDFVRTIRGGLGPFRVCV